MPQAYQDNSEKIRDIKDEIVLRYTKAFDGTPFNEILKQENQFLSTIPLIIEDNLRFAWETFADLGFVDVKRFGYENVKKFWIFVFLGDISKLINFKKRYLLALEKNLKDYSLLRPLYAQLYDKIAIYEGKSQKYGAFEDSSTLDEEVRQRKEAMGL